MSPLQTHNHDHYHDLATIRAFPTIAELATVYQGLVSRGMRLPAALKPATGVAEGSIPTGVSSQRERARFPAAKPQNKEHYSSHTKLIELMLGAYIMVD